MPAFISIEKYQELTNLEHLSDIGKMVRTINVFTGIDEDEIKTWAVNDMGKVAKDFSTKLDVESQFFQLHFQLLIYSAPTLKNHRPALARRSLALQHTGHRRLHGA